ncbi:hypothetical protein JHK85_024713 [Glycine max]|nr:hypothetical protein JHK85_024713 [Glycine max]
MCRAEKILVLSTLIQKTNAQKMKWIIMIILKDLKLGISEKSIFHEFHPDAEVLFKVTCDLKLVCEKLRDRNQRHKRQDIEVGKAVRPQLAKRVANATEAWKNVCFAKPFIQSLMPQPNHWNFIDHSEYAHAMSEIIIQNVLVDRRTFIFTVYWVVRCHCQQEVKSIRYIVQRWQYSGEPCWSFIAHNVDGVERFFIKTIENRDEGIVLKDHSSKWEPSDCSGKWLKLKPEYIQAGSDLDVLIIGGCYGSGRRGGEVARFLVGLAERPSPNTHPKRFISFCRVGTGLPDDELDAVVTKQKPYFRKYEYPKKMPPSFYQVTNHSKERPDMWVDSPEKLIIRSITSDIRTIESESRIDRVRYGKPWYECFDVQSFIELVHSSNGTTQRDTEYGSKQDSKPKRLKSSTRGEKKNLSIVPSHLIQTDVSSVKGGSLIFSNMMFYFVNVPQSHSPESLHKLIAENGGTFSMNSNNSVMHCVAADSKGSLSLSLCLWFKFEAAKHHGDIIHYSWVLDCYEQKKLVCLQPKYFLFLSGLTKKLQEEVDEFSDTYHLDLDLGDIKPLLSNIHWSKDVSTVDHYRKKYCPKDKWSFFYRCSFYFHYVIPSLKSDWHFMLQLALRRFKLEVLMGGGKVTSNLTCATHLVALLVPGYQTDFEQIQSSEVDLGLEAHLSGDNVEEQKISFSDKGIQQRSVKAVCEDSMALEIDTSAGSLDFYKKRSEPQETEECENVQVAEIGENFEQNKADKQEDLNDNEHERMLVPEIEMSDRHNEQSNEVTEKLEISDYPLQAMLFDMIPSLATQKVKQPMNRSVREEKLPETSNAEAEPMITKKKKVSYKDVASELLKGW